MVEIMTVGAIITLVTNKVFETLVGRATEGALTKLNRDPARGAFQDSLTKAIRSYAVGGTRLQLAAPLLAHSSLLADPSVADEIGKLLLFEKDPDTVLIGERWKDAVDEWPDGYDPTSEARRLVGYIEAELSLSRTFRPVFDSRSLASINEASTEAATALSQAEAHLLDLLSLMRSHRIRDCSRYMDEKTVGFVGRQWLFDAVDSFVSTNGRGYYFLRGDPGIGKSAFAAKFVKTRGCVHHFNIRAEGINRADIFLTNVCWQLIKIYGLSHAVLPAGATQDAGFLNELLAEVAGRLAGRRAVIVVDALDEVDKSGLVPGVNPLCLPANLPPGIFFVVTSRKDTLGTPEHLAGLRVDCENRTLYLEHNAEHHIADILAYLDEAATRPRIREYMRAQGIAETVFVERLREKSEGNFMYLHYVLPELERGAYRDMQVDALPSGLANYYEDHWRRMRGQDEDAWFEYKLKVVMALTSVTEPVSIDLLSAVSGVRRRPRIRAVLNDWAPFIHAEKVSYEGAPQERYRIYHASFHDFIVGKQEVADEMVSLEAAYARAADYMRGQWFGDDAAKAAQP